VSRVLGGARSTLVRELGAFGVVGAVGFALDVALFQVLYTVADLGAVTAKLLAGLASTTFAFAAHRNWSFAHRAQLTVGRGYALFLAVNAATLLLTLGVVAFVRHVLHQEDVLVLQAANVASIGAGTAVRFLAYRRWVFPAPR